MKKALRIVGISFVLLLAVLIALPFLLKDKIAEKIRSAINDQVNAEVYFSDASVSLFNDFPNLSIEIDSLRISNLEPFEGVDLVNIGKLSASMNLLSALGSEIKILNVALDNPIIDIRVLPDGRANYDIAKESDEVATEEAATEDESGFTFNLKEYTITKGYVSYVDETMPMSLKITELEHTGTGDFTADQFILKTLSQAESINFEYDGIRYIREAKADITANLDMNLSEMFFKFSDNLIKLNGLELAAEGFIKMPADDIEMDISFSAPSSDFKQLLSLVPAEFASDLTGVEASGAMAFSGFVKGIYNDNSMPGFGLKMAVENGRFNYPDLPASAENIQIAAALDASDGNQFDNMTLDISKFHVELADNPVDFQLKLSHPISDPDIDLKVQSQLDLANISKVIPMDGNDLKGRVTADFALDGRLSSIEKQAYGEFDAHGQLILQEFLYHTDSLPYDVDISVAYFNFSPQYLELSQFKSNVGRSNISANGKIDNYLSYYLKDEVLNGNFNFNSTFLDLNEFMESESEETVATTTTDSTASVGVFRVPRNVNFGLNAKIDELIYDNLNIKNVSGNLGIADGVAVLREVKMSLLEGVVTMNGDYDSRPEQPVVDFDLDVREFDIQKTVDAFGTVDKIAPIAKRCTGKFSTKMKFSATMDQNMEPIEETMEGKGTLETKTIYVEGFEPLMKVADALGIEKLAKQNINDVKLSFVIRDGKAVVDPFVVKLEGIPTTIYGYTTFDAGIDYHADLEIPIEKLPSKVGSEATKLTGLINSKLGTNITAGTKIPVKVHITGTVQKPVVVADLKGSAQAATQGVIDQVKEEVKEQVKEIIDNTKEEALQKAREEADKILADAQKQADQIVSQAKTQSDNVRTEGYKQAKDLEDKAKNPIEKAGAKIAADKLRKETDKSADKIVSEAQKQADNVMASARQRADDKLKSVE